MTDVLVKQKVQEWNQLYRQIGREIADLTAEAYEAEVGSNLLDVCEGDKDLAEAVFNHSDNQGGWMQGDALSYIKRQ